jgi:hypothetical protein
MRQAMSQHHARQKKKFLRPNLRFNQAIGAWDRIIFLYITEKPADMT